jgi:hypothetical protein
MSLLLANKALWKRLALRRRISMLARSVAIRFQQAWRRTVEGALAATTGLTISSKRLQNFTWR